jgi:hypothetical protein
LQSGFLEQFALGGFKERIAKFARAAGKALGLCVGTQLHQDVMVIVQDQGARARRKQWTLAEEFAKLEEVVHGRY